MRLLLDTHVMLALVDKATASLEPHVKRLLEAAGAELHVSVASLWEIAIKSRLGKLALDLPLAELPNAIEVLGLGLVVIGASHALELVDPEPATRDPFDRMLLAQCQIEGLRLLTVDRKLIGHPLVM